MNIIEQALEMKKGKEEMKKTKKERRKEFFQWQIQEEHGGLDSSLPFSLGS